MINGDIESTNEFALNFLTPAPLDNLQIYEFSGITDKGYSNYNAGFVTFRQAMTHGAQFQMDYTWGHAIGNGGTNQQYLVSSNSPYNINIDKASETFDHRQTFHAFGYYELPFGKGKAYLNNGVADRIIGGWHTAGIFTLYSGAPVCVLADGDWGSFFNETCATPSGAFPSYSPHNGVVGPGGFGVVNAFANPAAVLASLSHPLFSGVERNDADPLRTFPYWNLDFSLGKNVAVTERFKIVATADVFNLFNHVILQSPSSGRQSGSRERSRFRRYHGSAERCTTDAAWLASRVLGADRLNTAKSTGTALCRPLFCGRRRILRQFLAALARSRLASSGRPAWS